MLFDFGFQSSLLLIFFVHGLVYAWLLLRRGWVNENRSDKWLGVFLLICILYISPWMLGFGGWYDRQPYRDLLFYIPFQQLYFIGPVIFFYVQSLLNPSFRFDKKQWWHLLPGLLYLLFSIGMWVTDKIVLGRYYFLANEKDPDFDTWYQLTGYASMFFYFLLSLRYYTLYRKLILQVISYAERVMFRWVRHFLLAFLLMLVVRLVFFIIGWFIADDYSDTWWYFFAFALIFYYIAITGYANSVETKVGFRSNLFGRPTMFLLEKTETTTASPEVEAEVIEISTAPPFRDEDLAATEAWKEKLLFLLQAEKIYEDPELSLAGLARKLETNPSFLSKLINRGFGLNFNDFINQFRVEAVREMIKKGEHRRQTLLSIAFECGFNSKATFNRAFRKATGMAPKDYIPGTGD